MFVEECNTVRFGNVARVIHGFPFKSELYAPDDGLSPRVVSIGNFDYSGGFRIGGDWKVYKGHYPSNYDLNPGDVLLVMTCQTEGGEILGIPATIPDDGRSYLHNQRLGRIQMVRPDCADLRFLYWVCLTPAFNDELCASASGTKIQHTAPSRIESFEFQLPDLESQRRIATALDALDSRIALNEKLNGALEATAAAVFKSWFVDFDPVVAKSEGRKPFGMTDEIAALFPDRFAPNGLPEGWKSGKFGDIAMSIRKGANPSLHDLPYVGLEHIPRKRVTLDDWGHSSDVSSQKASFSRGDILFGKLRPYFHKVCLAPFDGICSTDILVLRPCHANHLSFVLLHAFSNDFVDFADSSSGGTRMPRTDWHSLKTFPVSLPPDEVLRAFERVCHPLFEHLILNQKQNQALRNLRDAILPGLVSGELQIKDLQKEVVAL